MAKMKRTHVGLADRLVLLGRHAVKVAGAILLREVADDINAHCRAASSTIRTLTNRVLELEAKLSSMEESVMATSGVYDEVKE